MNIKIMLLLVIIVVYSCSNKKENPTVIADSTIKSQDTTLLKSDDTYSTIEKHSIESIDNGYVNIISNGMLTNNLFVSNSNANALQDRYNHIFSVKKDTIIDSDGVFYTDKLVYKDSFIKVFHNNITNSDDIVSARIRDGELKMINQIYIGMEKKHFLEIILGSVTIKDSINTLINSDELGDIIQEFSFKDNKLKEVIIKSNYDWIDLEL